MTGGKTSIGTIAPPRSARVIPSAGPSALNWCSFETTVARSIAAPDATSANSTMIAPVASGSIQLDAEQERRGEDDEAALEEGEREPAERLAEDDGPRAGRRRVLAARDPVQAGRDERDRAGHRGQEHEQDDLALGTDRVAVRVLRDLADVSHRDGDARRPRRPARARPPAPGRTVTPFAAAADRAARDQGRLVGDRRVDGRSGRRWRSSFGWLTYSSDAGAAAAEGGIEARAR